ncbi:uncharacterized protein [Miscanthus floridulus]|uniref:uncharacterized protein n=1 Tax=Miscanthus floridulus TaxID=154761 RepID=UPI00345B18E0
MGVPLADKASAKEVWDSITAACIGIDRVRRVMLQRLRKDWENIAFYTGEQIEDFALRLSALKQQMAHHSDTDLIEERVVEKLLRAMPKKYAQLRIAIETLLDFQDLTRRLKTVDDLEEEPPIKPISVGGKLMYTEEQWLTRQKEKKKGGDGSGSSSPSKEHRRRPRGCKKQKPKGDRGDRGGGGQGEKAGVIDSERKVNHDDTCLNCHRIGHWAKDCPQPRRERGDTTHVAEADDDEATFYLAHSFLELDAMQRRMSSSPKPTLASTSRSLEPVHSSTPALARTSWMVEIQGVGSIMFQGKTDEHRILHGIYYILALRNSIMSLGQLDDGGSNVEIDKGVLQIWDRRG